MPCRALVGPVVHRGAQRSLSRAGGGVQSSAGTAVPMRARTSTLAQEGSSSRESDRGVGPPARRAGARRAVA